MSKFKKLIPVLLTVSLLFSGVALASNSKLLNSKVSKVVDLVVNKKKINTDAVIINGVTYVPIRAVGDVFSMNAEYKNSTVYLSSNEEQQTNNEVQFDDGIENEKNNEELINNKEKAIKENEDQIVNYEALKERLKRDYSKPEDAAFLKNQIDGIDNSINFLRESNEKLKSEIENLK